MKARPLPRMIYTPRLHVPIGVGIKRPDGTYALQVKCDQKIDEIPLEQLIANVVLSVEDDSPNDREPPQRRRPSYSSGSSI